MSSFGMGRDIHSLMWSIQIFLCCKFSQYNMMYREVLKTLEAKQNVSQSGCIPFPCNCVPICLFHALFGIFSCVSHELLRISLFIAVFCILTPSTENTALMKIKKRK